MDNKNLRNTISNLKNEVMNDIRLALRGLKELYIYDIEEGYSPIVREGSSDDSTYVLDAIIHDGLGNLTFDASSSDDNITLSECDIDIETALEIKEFLDDHAEEIKEVAAEPSEPKTLKKFVIRKSWTGYLDFEVEARSEEDAINAAKELDGHFEYEPKDIVVNEQGFENITPTDE